MNLEVWVPMGDCELSFVVRKVGYDEWWWVAARRVRDEPMIVYDERSLENVTWHTHSMPTQLEHVCYLTVYGLSKEPITEDFFHEIHLDEKEWEEKYWDSVDKRREYA